MLLTDFLLIFPELNILFLTWNDRNRANTHRFRVTDKCWVLYNLVLAGGWLIWSVLQKIRNSRCCLKILFWKNKFITNCLSKMLCAFYQEVGIHSSFIVYIWDKAVFTLQWFEIVILYMHWIWFWAIKNCIDMRLSCFTLHLAEF